MSASLGLSENNNSALFYLENDSTQPIAIQVKLTKRIMDTEGIETNPAINGELSVYPSQLIIQPNEKRSIKVSWMTKFIPAQEEAYRLIAEQLPIDLEKTKAKKASIKVLLKYVAALYVAGEDFHSDARLKSFEIKNDKVIFTVENNGKKHQVLNNLVMQIRSSKTQKDLTLSGNDLKGMIGENVLAGSVRRFSFPRAEKFAELKNDDKVKISFDID